MDECKICRMAGKKEQARIIYEDAAVMAVLSGEPTIFGHVLVFPKKHMLNLEDADDKLTTQLFYVASYVATAIFEGLGAEGTNLVICNGKNSDQRYPHLVIDVLPRKTNDGLNLKWDAKRQTPDDMEKAMSKIKDKADLINMKKEEKSVKEGSDDGEKQEMVYGKDNYLIRQLTRIP